MRRVIFALATMAAALTVAAATVPAQAAVNVKLQSGSTYVGASDLQAGTSVTEVTQGSARNMTITDLGPCCGGDTQVRIRFSNGNSMASNSACNGVTIKSDINADGTVWREHFNNSDLYLWSSYCVRTRSDGTWRLAGHNILGRQWTLCDASPGNGCFIKIKLVAA